MSNRSTIPSGPVALARSPAMSISAPVSNPTISRHAGQSPVLWRMCTSGCYNCIQGVYPCLDSDKFSTISITIPPAKRICVAK